jgi:hypothetical protein
MKNSPEQRAVNGGWMRQHPVQRKGAMSKHHNQNLCPRQGRSTKFHRDNDMQQIGFAGVSDDMSFSKAKLSRQPSQADKELARELFSKIPLMDRGTPIQQEMLWVLLGRQNAEQHVKLLPEYCYNIFDVFRKTYFKGFPALSETIKITNPAALPEAKSIEASKKVLQLNWKNLGNLSSILKRCTRFAQMEAQEELEKDGFSGSSPEEITRIFTTICGKEWATTNQSRIETENPNVIIAGMLQTQVASTVSNIPATLDFESLAYQWGPEALADFHAGEAEGMSSFVDFDRQLAGESSRSGIYSFLLLVWPEIKAMQESASRKNLTDLHEWLEPFMRVGLMPYIELDTLRDICAPPAQFGIGLSFKK